MSLCKSYNHYFSGIAFKIKVKHYKALIVEIPSSAWCRAEPLSKTKVVGQGSKLTLDDPMVLGCSPLSAVSGGWLALSLWLPLTLALEASSHAGAPPDQAFTSFRLPQSSLKNVLWTGAWNSDQLLRAGRRHGGWEVRTRGGP